MLQLLKQKTSQHLILDAFFLKKTSGKLKFWLQNHQPPGQFQMVGCVQIIVGPWGKSAEVGESSQRHQPR